MNEKTNKLINTIGAVAEQMLLVYRTAMSSGATREEASDIASAYLKTMMEFTSNS